MTVRKYSNDTECQCVMYIYYYYLCLVTPALRKCHKVSTASRHLTRAIPWMKGYRLPKPDTTSASVDSEQKAVPVREQLLHLAETAVRDAAHRAEAQGLGSPYTLHTPNVTKWQTTPNTACAAKNKGIPVPSGGDMATREMFSHARHPLERPLKQVSGMSSLLEKHYTCSFFTLNVLSQRHLIEGFLKPARDYFLQSANPVGGGGNLTSSGCFPRLAEIRSSAPTEGCSSVGSRNWICSGSAKMYICQ